MKIIVTSLCSILLCYTLSAQSSIEGEYTIPPEIAGFANTYYSFNKDGSFYYSTTSGNCHYWTHHVGYGTWEQVGEALVLKMKPYTPLKEISEVLTNPSTGSLSTFQMVDE